MNKKMIILKLKIKNKKMMMTMSKLKKMMEFFKQLQMNSNKKKIWE